MGKGIANYGFKSGILPVTRSILKNPTNKQVRLVEKAKQPLPKGRNGLGYAEGIMHPDKSHRDPPPVKFIDVETLIQQSVPIPKAVKPITSEQQIIRSKKAELRRKYLSEAFRKEETRLIEKEKLISKKDEIIEKQREEEMKKINLHKSSDLTIPSLDHIVNQPLMRTRTDEETTLLQMKRKYNREMLEFKAKETKLENLLELYYEADQYIVTEEQLLKNLDAIFDETRFSSNTNSILEFKNNTKKNNLEQKIGDTLFGTVRTTNPGLPLIKEFLSGESVEFIENVKTVNEKILNERKNNVDNILP